MDAIKNKMKSLKTETENALSKAHALDTEAKEANTKAEKAEEQVRDLQKKMQHVENELDQTIEKLQSTVTRLDEKDKAYQTAEGEIQALQRYLLKIMISFGMIHFFKNLGSTQSTFSLSILVFL